MCFVQENADAVYFELIVAVFFLIETEHVIHTRTSAAFHANADALAGIELLFLEQAFKLFQCAWGKVYR